jgi:uncharacterized Ntn-hydrolase superfamily protein
VPYVKSGVGAVATQAFVNPYLGIWGLEQLSDGRSAPEVVAHLMEDDPDPDRRQLTVLDANGRAAAHTGAECVEWCGEIVGENFAIAGNMLVGEETLRAMERTWLEGVDSGLGDRLLGCLEAGQAAGGDKRGRVSAAMRVASGEEYATIDVRVDEHPEPVEELRRIYDLACERHFPILAFLPSLANPRGDPEGAAAMGSAKLSAGK